MAEPASGQSVQRYYDPAIGRFLSVDPVTAYEQPGQNFNRYWYAGNNPYRFTDPDGRRCSPIVNAAVRGITGGGPTCAEIDAGKSSAVLAAEDQMDAQARTIVWFTLGNASGGFLGKAGGPVIGAAWKHRTPILLAAGCLFGKECKNPNDYLKFLRDDNPELQYVEQVNNLRRIREMGELNNNGARPAGAPPAPSGAKSLLQASQQQSAGGITGVVRIEGRLDSERLRKLDDVPGKK